MRAFARDQQGAVYVEFLISFLPLFVLFLSLSQLASLYQAKLIVMHSAETAARAAIVVLPDDPARYDQLEVGRIVGKRAEAIVKAAALPLAASRDLVGVRVRFPSSNGTDEVQQVRGNDLVRVRVEALFRCAIPIAKYLVCDSFSRTRKLSAEAALPNQGADYVYE